MKGGERVNISIVNMKNQNLENGMDIIDSDVFEQCNSAIIHQSCPVMVNFFIEHALTAPLPCMLSTYDVGIIKLSFGDTTILVYENGTPPTKNKPKLKSK